ncbi:MAG: ABC transporter permease [Chloroflexota bacterium]|nr:ABC transporter permease [Chloroflexota bacterium]
MPDLGGMWQSIVRMASFTGKELREVVRRPGVLLSLVLGPFLIMFLFGLGYSGYRAPFVTEIVVPADADFSRTAEDYEDLAPGRLEVAAVSEDRDGAEARLRAGEIDLLVVAPENSAAELREGNQTTIRVAWNQVDPVYDQLATLATSILVSSLNAEIIERAAVEGISFAEGELGPAVSDVPPEVIARPTTAETENVAPTDPRVLNFFGPAVFALVIQHLAVTLTALSMVRERLSGQMDRFRVAPVSSMELLVGKYVAYAVLSLAVSAIVGALLVGVLAVPLLGSIALFIGIVLLLTFASLGFGLLISLIADSERQAVQLSMLILLASVFFSGFVLPVSDFAQWMQYIAYLLPVTHGIATLQELMLRGEVRETWMLGALLTIGVVLYVGSLLRLRRVIRTADA